MDSSKKKELKKAFLQHELQKLADGEDDILANYAKRKMNTHPIVFTKRDIDNCSDTNLINTVNGKIKDLISYRQKNEWAKFKSEFEAINALSVGQKMIYFTSIFEDMNDIGDLDKFQDNSFDWELEWTFEAYRLVDLQDIAFQINDRGINKVHLDDTLIQLKKIAS